MIVKYKILLAFIIPLLCFTSCAVGPDFKSPQVDLPKRFSGDTLVVTTADSMVSMQWWRMFGDPMLDSLIVVALENNLDIKTTLTKVDQAWLQYRNTRSSMAPSFGLNTGAQYSFVMPSKVTQTYTITPTMSWELGLFGSQRRASESSAATVVSVGFQYNAAMLALVSQVAQTYFSLLEYKLSLIISEKSYLTRQSAYELMIKMHQYGAISMVALNQSKTLMLTAQISVENFKTAITETSNSLCMLLGDMPHNFDINPYKIMTLNTPNIPSGITPAWVIDNRPDVMSSYYDVWSTSAQIGVAVSRRFPSINISADGGVAWDIFHKGGSLSKPYVWGASLTLVQSLLNFGINKRNVDIARLSNKAAIYSFEQTVITALSEVENALSQIATLNKRAYDYLELVNTTGSINYMTTQLYQRGAIDYLQVLDSERSYLNAQLDYCSILQQKMSSYVTLYKSLGGYLL